MSSANDHPLKPNLPLDLPSDSPKAAKKDDSAAEAPIRPSMAESAARHIVSTASVTSSNPSSSTTLPVTSGASTPTSSTLAGSFFSQTGSKHDLRNSTSSPSSAEPSEGAQALVAQAFAPHISVLSSSDCEELLRHKGIHGGLLELLRPFGETIPGRVVVRDSTGASKPLDDFGIRFMGIKDGLEAPRLGLSAASPKPDDSTPAISAEYKPARIRSGGDVVQIEQLVERQLDQATETGTYDASPSPGATEQSPFFKLYMRKLLSGVVLSPHETFAHPVALVIAISSRSTSPIEDLRTLYSSSNTGEHRLPAWVNNEYLRYYVLVHDEDFDDIKKSTALYEQMKRHFGLHCHLLRLRSTQCLPSDDGAVRLTPKVWTSAAEDLADLSVYDSKEEETPSATHIFEIDATSVRSFVREMVTQSILPSMERAVATWNDQVASRRRGISGRFMSLSKRFTPFGGRSSSPSTSGSNYDTVTGSYRPDLPEAIMRKLADYAVMLRDYKLATSTYEILCGDYKNDKAWRYYAGANEMAAVTYMMAQGSLTTRTRAEILEPWIENAYYSYFVRCNGAFYSLRAVVLAAELLRSKEGGALDDAARWLARLMDDKNIGPVGHALLLEITGSYFALKRGTGTLRSGGRRRKAALWFTLATSAWLEMDKHKQAGRCLDRAVDLYKDSQEDTLQFEGMQGFLDHLGRAVESAGPEKLEAFPDIEEDVEQIQQTTQTVDQRTHRRSVSLAVAKPGFDPLGVAPMTTPRSTLPDRQEQDADGFE